MGRGCILIPFALTQQINLRKDNSYFSSNIMNEWVELFMVLPSFEKKWILGGHNCSQEGNQEKNRHVKQILHVKLLTVL